MKITNISAQLRNPHRVNISIDGVYKFSFDISQVTELGIKIGREVNEDDIALLKIESQFGRLYTRALEYCCMRPHSVKEVKDYLWKKTQPLLQKDGTRKIVYSPTLTERVLLKLQQKNYVNDEQFARVWIENRWQKKGTSLRKLRAELRMKGVSAETIEKAMGESDRTDERELQKVIAKKASCYPNDQKFIQYLMRQGFNYDDIRAALK